METTTHIPILPLTPAGSIRITSMPPITSYGYNSALASTAARNVDLECSTWCYRFLYQVPKSDEAWNATLKTSNDVHKLFYELTHSVDRSVSGENLDWAELFRSCSLYLDDIPVFSQMASFYSLVFVATCHFAILTGCPVDTVNQAMRSGLKNGYYSVEGLGDEALEDVRQDVLVGIRLISECVDIIGYRGYELLLYCKLWLRFLAYETWTDIT